MELIIDFVFHCCYAVLILADCPPPSSVPNAAFSPNQTSYAEGATVTFTCKDGYELDGRRIHTCRGSSWEGSLTCHEQFCETITTPRNGRIVGNPSYKIATYITFECNTGYTLNGRTQLLCRVDLKFDGNPPTCDVKMCPNFGVIDHARIFQATDGGIENDYGSVVKVTCEDTYVLNGPAHVICQADGTWGSKPTCKPLDCGRFDGMNSSCVKSFILFETLYYMECETDVPNTRIGGPSTSTPNECLERSQQWEYSVFGCFCHCKVMYNQTLVTTRNLTYDYLPHGSVLQWSCTAGCTKHTTNALICNDGQMEMPSCTCKDHVPTEEPYLFNSTIEPNTSSSTLEPNTSRSTLEPNTSSSTIAPYTSSSNIAHNTSSSTIVPNTSISSIAPYTSSSTFAPHTSSSTFAHNTSSSTIAPNTSVPATTASTQANSPEHPTSAFVPTTDSSDRVTLSFIHPSSISTSSILTDVTTSSKTDVKTSKSPSDALTTSESSHSTLDSTPKRLVIKEHPVSQPDLDYEIRSPTPVSVGSPAALPSYLNSPFYNPVSPLLGNMVTSAPTPNYEPEVSQQQPQSALEASAFSTPYTKPQPIAVPVYIPTPRHLSQKEVLKTRAHSLLLEGRLPLLPPARREWSDIPSHSIQITPNISWPPADWTSLSPDQRTLSHEFVAMTLHSENKPLPRSYLRAKFNFLALPGSLDLQNDALAATLKTNFNLVGLIALGEDPTTPEVQMTVLSAFEALPRDSSLDVLLSRVKDVPLRLKKQICLFVNND